MFGAALIAAGACVPGAAARNVPVDFFDKSTPKLDRGQIEVVTLSTMPKTVTGGDVTIEVRGLSKGDRLRVERNGRDVTRVFSGLQGGARQGLVRGLRDGPNRITATSGSRRATLKVVSHPVTGPVISGPHQKPFYCQTEDAGLGKPLDKNCSIKTRTEWFYRSRVGGSFSPLANPYSDYPADVMQTRTADGQVVPFVVRMETATINRGIARIAVLDDPAARGPKAPFEPALWDHVMTYGFGESCGVGYRQGSNSAGTVLGGPPQGISSDSAFAALYGLADRLGEGDLVAISTLTTFGVYCNPAVSAETLMMIKEHVTESYGRIERTIGIGGSGGALQQYNAANSYPGLLDGATPIASFADIPSTAMTVVDCGLLHDYFNRSAMDWTDLQRAQVAGHATPQICKDWIDFFLPALDPTRGCSGEIPDKVRYDRRTNPDGVRCTLQDATAGFWGVREGSGFANRPYDNVGVQYGLRALNAGQINMAQFLDLNDRIGGYNLDARNTAKRSAMSRSTAHRAYKSGFVIGRGALAQTPVIDLAAYLDLIPALDIHDVVRPFGVRSRLAARGSAASQRIWRGVALPPDARPAIEEWVDGVDRKSGGMSRERAVAAAQPRSAGDRCIAAAGAALNLPDDLSLPLGLAVQLLPGAFPGLSIPLQVALPETQLVAPGICQSVFTARSGTRIVAGGPRTDDNIKCRLKPVDPGDYARRPSPAELKRLRAIFRAGVCDWSRPPVGDVKRSILWPSLGGEKLERAHPLKWTAARSK